MSFIERYGLNGRLSSHSSSGLLIYAALVDLLAQDFLSEEADQTLTKKNKIRAFIYVLLGGEFVHFRSLTATDSHQLPG